MATANTTKVVDEGLIPHLVDARAQSGYNRPFALTPRSKDPADGFKEITYSQLANAVNRTAWWLDSQFSDNVEPYAYLGPNDFRYMILVIASVKTQRQVCGLFALNILA
jgi:hypothetical protein